MNELDEVENDNEDGLDGQGAAFSTKATPFRDHNSKKMSKKLKAVDFYGHLDESSERHVRAGSDQILRADFADQHKRKARLADINILSDYDGPANEPTKKEQPSSLTSQKTIVKDRR